MFTVKTGLLMGFFGTTLNIVGLFIAYIVYERHRKNIERIEADKKKTLPYDFS
jgi:uncharacterized membrane protein